MIKRIVRMLLLDLYQKFLFRKIRRGSINAVKNYIKGVQLVRWTVMGGFGLAAMAACLVTGVILVLIGVMGLFPIEAETLAITMLVIGAALSLISGGLMLMLFSEKRWLEASRSYELMNAALAPWPNTLPPNPVAVFRGRGSEKETTGITRTEAYQDVAPELS